MRKSLISASFFIPLLAWALAAQADEVIEEPSGAIINKALEMGLDQSREWKILLHYTNSTGTWESQIDDPAFFFSPDGKYNPKEELIATIKAFYWTDKEGDEHPICMFPARFHWLDRKTRLKDYGTPDVSCPELEKAMKDVNPQKVTLVFASAHINSPASMFGHPLIRIDSQKESKLLSQAVNYAARTGESRGFFFAFNGIFGFYHGFYSLMPYYEKVSEYNDFDLRDLWEYETNLSRDEAMQMMRHIWEVKDKYSYYYFFSENCALIILYLLEAARPSVNLTDRWGSWVIPVDTLRRTLDSGLVENVKFRPSKMSKINALMDSMSDGAIKAAMDISKTKAKPEEAIPGLEDDDSKKRTLDLAAELLQHSYNSKKIEKDVYTKYFLDTLKQRGKLGGEQPFVKEINPPVRPDMGHRSAMFAFGVESTDGPKGYRHIISLRPSLHELMDPHDGYVPGSQIEFLRFDLSFTTWDSEVWLDRLDLVNIVSLSPVNRLFTPISWKVRAGWLRKDFEKLEPLRVFAFNTGGGYSASLGDMGMAYIMGEVNLEVNPNFEGGVAAGPAASAGLLLDLFPGWKTGLFARADTYAAGGIPDVYEFKFAERYSFGVNAGIHLEAVYTRLGEKSFTRGNIRLIMFH